MYEESASDKSSSEQYLAMKVAISDIVGQNFRPEFINRIDEMVVFHPLDKEQIKGIAKIQIKQIVERLAERDITLEVTEQTLVAIADIGFDPIFGARPLKRAIQQRLENPLANAILSGDIDSGETIVADWVDAELVLK